MRRAGARRDDETQAGAGGRETGLGKRGDVGIADGVEVPRARSAAAARDLAPGAMSWLVIGAVALCCFALRASGPFLLRGRSLPDPLRVRLEAAVGPVLGGLVVTQLLVTRGGFAVDARVAGAAAGGALYLRLRSVPAALVAACLVTAVIRL